MKYRALLLSFALVACSEPAGNGSVSVDAALDTPNDTPGDTPNDTPGDAPADVPADVPGDAAPAGRLVINEINAVGAEWVELFNAGTAPVDLSDIRLADSESDGGPRVSRAMRFPTGTTLAPGQYVLVVANQSDAGAGPQTRCLGSGPTMCFHAGWSLSASRGENVHVLSPFDAPIASELFPMNATPDGRSWGRLPNGTGPFAVNRPSPGATNAAP